MGTRDITTKLLSEFGSEKHTQKGIPTYVRAMLGPVPLELCVEDEILQQLEIRLSMGLCD